MASTGAGGTPWPRPAVAGLALLAVATAAVLIFVGASRTEAVAATGVPESTSVLLCRSDLNLTTVYRIDGRIRFEGVAAPKFRGRSVRIYDVRSDAMVAVARVAEDGTWWTSAKTGGHRYTWLSKFVAESGSAQSPWRRLGQAISVRGRKTAGSSRRTRIHLKVSGGQPERLIVGQQDGCSRYLVNDRFRLRTDRDGVATISLPRPRAGESPAVYRVRTANGAKISPPIVVRPATGQ